MLKLVFQIRGLEFKGFQVMDLKADLGFQSRVLNLASCFKIVQGFQRWGFKV